MIKDSVVAMVCYKTMYSRSIVESVLDAILDTVTESLANGEKVQFSGFGTFEPKKCKARVGRNPQNNKAVPIPARIVPYFRAGKSLKDAVIKPIDTSKNR